MLTELSSKLEQLSVCSPKTNRDPDDNLFSALLYGDVTLPLITRTTQPVQVGTAVLFTSNKTKDQTNQLQLPEINVPLPRTLHIDRCIQTRSGMFGVNPKFF
jgi:hypothetical protein